MEGGGVSGHGWFSEWDEEAQAFQPVIQTKHGTIARLDIWYDEETHCDGFIRQEVIGEGMIAD